MDEYLQLNFYNIIQMLCTLTFISAIQQLWTLCNVTPECKMQQAMNTPYYNPTNLVRGAGQGEDISIKMVKEFVFEQNANRLDRPARVHTYIHTQQVCSQTFKPI